MARMMGMGRGFRGIWRVIEKEMRRMREGGAKEEKPRRGLGQSLKAEDFL